MVRKGDILYNPVSRATVTFIQTAADTAGRLLQLDVSIAPGGSLCNMPMHIHPKQQERISLKSGKIGVTMDGINRVYEAGESVHIPAGTAHNCMIVSTQEELNFLYEVTPALHTETLVETVLAHFQGVQPAADSSIPILQCALTLSRHNNHFYLATYPVWIQKLVFKVLSPVALLMGYSAEIDYKKALFKQSSPTFLYD